MKTNIRLQTELRQLRAAHNTLLLQKTDWENRARASETELEELRAAYNTLLLEKDKYRDLEVQDHCERQALLFDLRDTVKCYDNKELIRIYNELTDLQVSKTLRERVLLHDYMKNNDWTEELP
jgi:hypothetical protein